MRHSQPTRQTTHSTNVNVDQLVQLQILEHPSLPWRASCMSESSDLQLLPPIQNTEYDLWLRTCFWWRCSCHRYPSHQDDQQVSGCHGNTAQGGSLELRGTGMWRMHQEVLIHRQNCFQVVCLSNSVRYKIKDKMTEEITENVGHLVLKVLCCNQGVQELSSPFNHSMNFATASFQTSVIIKGLLQVIDRLVPWFCSSINKDTDFRQWGEIRRCVGDMRASHTFSIHPMALKSQRWELIFFWFLAFRTRMIWTGTRLLGSFS